ncbi:MAG: serine/threonine protein kinase [Candidatus Riflebacteria bacterium]|nr:serine/threonine protein kinase [Candidatus Riflebacteria bacterium]
MKLVSQLSHPNIVRVFECGRSEGRWYYSMEIIEGFNLRQVRDQHGPLPLARVVDIAVQASDALVCVHEAGLSHRDIKLQNFMLDASGHLTLMDFGLAKAPASTLLTEEGHLLGTPQYLAPELLEGAASSPAQDVYALALCVHELLVGKAWCDAQSLVELAGRIAKGPAPTLERVMESPPSWLLKVQAAALARDPAARPTALQYGSTMRKFGVDGARKSTGGPAARRVASSAGGILVSFARRVDRRRAAAAVVAIVLFGALVCGRSSRNARVVRPSAAVSASSPDPAPTESDRTAGFSRWLEPRSEQFGRLSASREESDRARALDIAWECVRAAAPHRDASTSARLDPAMVSRAWSDLCARAGDVTGKTKHLSEGFNEWIIHDSVRQKSDADMLLGYARGVTSSGPAKNRAFLRATKATDPVYLELRKQTDRLLVDGTACAWAILGRVLEPAEEVRVGRGVGQIVEAAFVLDIRTAAELDGEFGRLGPCFSGTTIGRHVKAALWTLRNQPAASLGEMEAALNTIRGRLNLAVRTRDNLDTFRVWSEMNGLLFSSYLKCKGREAEALERIQRFYRDLPADPELRREIGAPLAAVRHIEGRLSRR